MRNVAVYFLRGMQSSFSFLAICIVGTLALTYQCLAQPTPERKFIPLSEDPDFNSFIENSSTDRETLNKINADVINEDCGNSGTSGTTDWKLVCYSVCVEPAPLPHGTKFFVRPETGSCASSDEPDPIEVKHNKQNDNSVTAIRWFIHEDDRSAYKFSDQRDVALDIDPKPGASMDAFSDPLLAAIGVAQDRSVQVVDDNHAINSASVFFEYTLGGLKVGTTGSINSDKASRLEICNMNDNTSANCD